MKFTTCSTINYLAKISSINCPTYHVFQMAMGVSPLSILQYLYKVLKRIATYHSSHASLRKGRICWNRAKRNRQLIHCIPETSRYIWLPRDTRPWRQTRSRNRKGSWVRRSSRRLSWGPPSRPGCKARTWWPWLLRASSKLIRMLLSGPRPRRNQPRQTSLPNTRRSLG